MTTDPNDADELSNRLHAGDDSALGEVFAQHGPRLLRTIQLRLDPRLRGRVDPEDVMQDAYLAASQRLDHYRRSDFDRCFVWLRAITIQTVVDTARRHLGAQKRSAGAEVSLHAESPTTDHTAACLAGHLIGQLTSPTRAAVRAELSETLAKVLEEMAPLDREILILRHFEGLTNNEAAQTLGIHKAASTNRYLRALRRLRDVLAEYPEFQELVGQ